MQKSLLIRLSVGLYVQDVMPGEWIYINEWMDQKYILKKDNIYRFHSKYRAGEIATVSQDRAYLRSIIKSVKDIIIYADDMQGAKEGDLVIVKRMLSGRAGAKVVEVIGCAKVYSVAFIALRDGVKTILDIKTQNPIGISLSEDEMQKYKVSDVFKIDNQTAKIVEILGNLEDPTVDEKIVLAQYNKHDKFSDEIIKVASGFREVDASFYPNRIDLRHLPFCTIDPVSAKDFDDAIYFDTNEYVLYVAIADVSQYVKPFGVIDIEAMYRGFSIYLPHRSIPMLPRKLSEGLCSLQPNVDRLSYTFKLTIDKKSLKVIQSDVFEAIIHSRRRFAYDEIDKYLSKKISAHTQEESDIINYILSLNSLTTKLRSQRLQNGFDFRSDEIEMTLDDNGELLSTSVASETPSHSLIEECMLLANKAAAGMYEFGVFRVHEIPSQSKMQSLYNELAGIGIFVEPQESVHDTIVFIQKKAQEMGIEADVDRLIIQSQKRARYSPENYGHFGLGFEKYTHFTSPIRRYSDLIVHRLIKAIKADNTKESSYVLRNIESLTIAISEKERESADVEFRFMDRKFARWANKHLGEIFQARIESTDGELIAMLDDKIKGASLHVKSQIPVVLFDKVLIKIENVDIVSTKIDVSVVKNLSNV